MADGEAEGDLTMTWEWICSAREWIRSYEPEIGFIGTLMRVVLVVPLLVAASLGLRKAYKEVRLRMRNRLAHQDYYYKERVFGYRLLEDGKTYINLRIEEVAPLSENLSSIHFAYSWTGNGHVEEEMKLLEPVDRTGTWRQRERPVGGQFQKYFCLDITPSIPRRTLWLWNPPTCKAAFKITAVATDPPQPFYGCKSDRRVDRLLMRVVFPPNHMPAKVVFRVMNDAGEDREPERVLKPDVLTGEYSVEIMSARPHLRYVIEWPANPKTVPLSGTQ